jgi:hypothetical protein
MTPTSAAVLTCHPATGSEAVHRIEARLHWAPDGALGLTYTVKGDLARLRIPALRRPGRKDRLWEHTCFEAFVSVKGKPEYLEFNFSPSGEWAVYAFHRYRERAPLVEEEPAPKVAVHSSGKTLELAAVVRLARLPAIHPGTPLRLALAAVIEQTDGSLSYWSLEHPSGKPDFHHPDSFALEITPPLVASADPSAMEKR